MSRKRYEMMLALLWLTRTGDGRAWKGQDWDAMDRLQAKGHLRPEEQNQLQRHTWQRCDLSA